MDDDEELFLKLPADPANVAVVRDAVAERASAFGLDPRSVDDLRTVVSEACSNVVLHAYPDGREERPLEVGLARRRARSRSSSAITASGSARPAGRVRTA